MDGIDLELKRPSYQIELIKDREQWRALVNTV
jgi:hypothetical protein